jgi:ATP-dependent DNA ligase
MGRENCQSFSAALAGTKHSDAASCAFIEPMKALSVHELPVGDWLCELKFDGYRALAWD